MMEKLVARGEQLAREAEARRVERVAGQMRALFGEGAVTVFETRAMAIEKDAILRWLTEPALRFLRRYE